VVADEGVLQGQKMFKIFKHISKKFAAKKNLIFAPSFWFVYFFL
jgi:hypothetical protein